MAERWWNGLQYTLEVCDVLEAPQVNGSVGGLETPRRNQDTAKRTVQKVRAGKEVQLRRQKKRCIFHRAEKVPDLIQIND